MDYRDEMRNFVISISKIGKSKNKNFLIVPQNALEIIDRKNPQKNYLNAIDALGLEDLYYGNSGDGSRTIGRESRYLLKYLKIFKSHQKKILVIDYVVNREQAMRSFELNQKKGFISIQTKRALDSLPEWNFNLHQGDVNTIDESRNFLYLLTDEKFKTANQYIEKIASTDYDIIIIDAFLKSRIMTPQMVNRLKRKKSGSKRIVLAYMSIGEAETYRYYWKKNWQKNPPTFLAEENPQWKENYKVRYWQEDWKKIIMGTNDGTDFDKSYLGKIINAGFDGVYLDIVDAAFYFEK